MATAAQIAANRANAQKSTGPKTSEGRLVCRMNAARHGLAGDTVLMPWEDAEAYKAHCDKLIDSLAPANPEEEQLAQAIADCYWRLNRAAAVDTNMFSLGVLDYAPAEGVDNPRIHAAICQARAFDARSKSWVNLTLYEQRIHRTLEKNRALLSQLQTNRELAEGMERGRLIAEAQRAHYEKQQAEKRSTASAPIAASQPASAPPAPVIKPESQIPPTGYPTLDKYLREIGSVSSTAASPTSAT